jgi:hypothetical protein
MSLVCKGFAAARSGRPPPQTRRLHGRLTWCSAGSTRPGPTRCGWRTLPTDYIDWFNNTRLYEENGDIPPVELEQA